MNVVFAVCGQIIVDDARDLLDIYATRQQISSDEDTGRTGTELPHDHFTLALVHVTVHSRHGKVALMHGLSQPVHLKKIN